MKYTVIAEKCRNCASCSGVCLVDALWIDLVTKRGFVIDSEKCVGCGICYQICPFEAIDPVK